MEPYNTATPSRRRSRLFLGPGPSPLASYSSHLGYPKRGSSLRPDDTSDARMSPSISSPSFTFGYGNETRITRSSFGLPPSNSPFQIAPKSPLAQRLGRSSLGPATGSDSPQRFRGGSLGPMSIVSASGVGLSPNERMATPKSRDWKTLNLASPRSPRPGDELMKEYLATRTLPTSTSKTRGMPVYGDYTGRSSRASSIQPDAVTEETVAPLTPSKAAKKREFDISIDQDEEPVAMPSARKRQMVWHPQLGFVSQEELKAREPKLPTPKNEAERLLNVLESMRKPKSPSAAFASSRALASIHVPVPVADRSLPKAAQRPVKDTNGPSLAATLAPYSRALRKSKLAHSQQGSEADRLSLRAKLRRSRASLQSSRVGLGQDVDEEEQAEEQDMQESETESEEEEPAPPKREVKKPVRRSRRLRGRAVDQDKEDEEMQEEEQAPQPRKVKAKPAKIAEEPRVEELKPAEEPKPVEPVKPTSQRISLAAAKPAGLAKDNFSVRAQADPSAPRERSLLRQGTAKTRRTHEKGTGRISAWEEDLEEDEDDLPDAQELAKIKLPTNMFPSGFSFGGAAPAKIDAKPVEAPKAPVPAPAPAKSTPSFSFGKPAEPKQTTEKKEADKPSSISLLGRLGGFTPATAASTTPQKPPPTTGFSFTAPAQTDKPSFSFNAETAKPAASNFFSTPVEPSKPAEEKSGPVPNIFGSAATKKSEKPKEVNTTATFNFGAPAAKAATPTFGGFGQPAEKKEEGKKTEPAPASQPFGGFNVPKKAEEPKPAAAPSFSFGAPSTTPAATPSKPSFSFGGAEKRSVEDDSEKKKDEEPAAKKAAPTFSFGASAKDSATSSTTFGGFDKPASEEKKDEPAASNKIHSFFGNSAAKTSAPAPSSTPSFSFGKPAEGKSASTSTFSGAPTSQPAASKAAASSFSFGAPSTPAHGPSSGHTNGDMMEDSPSSAPAASSAPAPFTFGSSGASTPTFGANSAAQSPKPTLPSFSFGTSSSGGFGAQLSSSSGGFGSSAAQSAGTSSGFGANAAQPAPTFGQQSTFSFGSPAPNPGFGATTFGGATSSFGAPSSSTATPSFGPPASAPFTFGSPAPFQFGTGSAPPTPSANQFGGGSTTPSTAPTSFSFPPQPSSPFAFNASNPTNPAPEAGTPPGSSAGLFSIGAAPSPGGRAIKPLRQRRR